MTSTPETAPRPRWLRWWLLMLVVTATTSVLLGQAPPRLRLFVLLPALEGAVIGALAVAIAQYESLLLRRRMAVVIAFVAISAAGSTSLWWWQQHALSIHQEFLAPPPEMLAMQLQSGAKKPGSPAELPSLEEQQQRTELMKQALSERRPELAARESFVGYLVFRVYGPKNSQGIGEHQSRAIALWVSELLAACVAALVVVLKTRTQIERRVGSDDLH